MSDSLWPHGLQHARLPCASPTPGACSNSCPSSWWCHPTILSSVVTFFPCLQSSPASGSFLVSQFFTSGGKVLELQHQSFQWILCHLHMTGLPLSFQNGHLLFLVFLKWLGMPILCWTEAVTMGIFVLFQNQWWGFQHFTLEFSVGCEMALSCWDMFSLWWVGFFFF